MAVLLAGCPGPGDDDDATPTPSPSPSGCRATPVADGERLLVVALPYDSGGAPVDVWAPMRLGLDGLVTDPGTRWTAPRSVFGEVRWTPDGSLGFVAADDGSLAVFDADGGGSESGDWYAEDVLIDPSGERLWIVDPNWPENGGGVYAAEIDCDTGALAPATKVVETKLAARLVAHADGPLLVHADPAGDFVVSRFDADAGTLEQLSSLQLPDAVISTAALSLDGAWLAVGENSEFSGVPTRVALFEVATGAVQVVQSGDPVALLPAPDGRFLAMDGYGNGGHWIARSGDTWSVGAGPAWLDPRPALPGVGAWIGRGALAHLALVGETGGVRGVDLDTGDDQGLLWSGAGLAGLVGSVGVQP